MSELVQMGDFQEHSKSKLLTEYKDQLFQEFPEESKQLEFIENVQRDYKSTKEQETIIDTRIIPIYDVLRYPKYPDSEDPELKKQVEVSVRPIFTNLFYLVMEVGEKLFEMIPVDYEIYKQDQDYALELAEKTKELLKTDSKLDFDPEETASTTSPEEEMTSIRANELYYKIMDEWDNIVLGRKNGDFDHDLQLQLDQDDYFSSTVYERAWEVNDIITTFIEGKYQKPTLFGNYKEIYLNLQKTNGKECARELVRLARLMSRCVSPETTSIAEDILETNIPTNANMKDA